MSDAMLAVLRVCLLVLIYLFFLRVLRAVWVEVRTPLPVAAGAPGRRAQRRAERAERPRRERAPVRAATGLVVVDPPEERGRIYDFDGTEVTIGRVAGCAITVDDTYVSQLHARVYSSDGQVMVEDLGSTNGTYLNRRRVNGPMVMQRGDKLQVGNTILEMR